MNDLRFVVRSLRRSPTLSIAVVLTAVPPAERAARLNPSVTLRAE